MNRWIRWKGLAVFAAVTVGLVLLWVLLIDLVAERVIEKTGTRMVGAKVELDGVDITLFPVGFTLHRLQVTHPEQPMTNAVEISRISAAVDGPYLLLRKVIIDEMSLEGVQFNTPRKTSGEIPGLSREKRSILHKERWKETLGAGFPTLTLPKVQDILKNENLESVKLVETLGKDIDAEQARWQKQLAELPDQKKIEAYSKRIEKLKSATEGGISGILGAGVEVEKLQKEIRSDVEKIKTAQGEFDSTVTSLKDRVARAAKAPREDVQRLMEKYSLTPGGLANLSRILFGEKIASWVQKALIWSERLEPFTRRVAEQRGKAEVVKPIRGKGVDVRFKESRPLPDFLIRLLQASLSLQVGEVAGRVENLTPDQDVLGSPLTFEFSGDKLTGMESLKLDGIVDRVSPATAAETINATIRGYQLKNLPLTADGPVLVSLARGLTDLDVQAEMHRGDITANLKALLDSASFKVDAGEGSGPIIQAFSSALSGVSRANIQATVKGTVEDYKIQLTSDLDRILKDAVGSQIQSRVNKLKGELTAAITDKVKGPLKGVQGSLGGLGPIGDELEKRLAELTGLQLQGSEGKPAGGIKLPF